jgi:2,4-dienoyl-CoA reductase-like NADH-dependent reductase (Old Yellow Enzyme family)
MSTLFSPYALRSLKLPNRIVVSPMCQYVANNGQANTWHPIHLGGLALSGAGLLFIEATAVEPDGASHRAAWDFGMVPPRRR